MAESAIPNISHFVTSYNPEGKSVYLDTTNPPPPYSEDENHRIDYIYSLSASATGPVLKGDVDYKEHQTVAATPPHILFPTAGASAAVVVTVRFTFLFTAKKSGQLWKEIGPPIISLLLSVCHYIWEGNINWNCVDSLHQTAVISIRTRAWSRTAPTRLTTFSSLKGSLSWHWIAERSGSWRAGMFASSGLPCTLGRICLARKSLDLLLYVLELRVRN